MEFVLTPSLCYSRVTWRKCKACSFAWSITGAAAGGVNAKIQIHMVGSPGALPVQPAAGNNDSDAADEFEHRAGNIKTALAGTYYHVSAKHAQRYLSSFAWRFNCRFQLDTLTERLPTPAQERHPIRTGSSSPDE